MSRPYKARSERIGPTDDGAGRKRPEVSKESSDCQFIRKTFVAGDDAAVLPSGQRPAAAVVIERFADGGSSCVVRR
jgi:hypothetical protein